MTNYAVLSRKGGVGKTVTSMYAAAQLKARGQDVALLDLDPEGSATTWARTAGNLSFPVYSHARRKDSLKHEHVVIDTPPNDPKILGDAARLAQRVIVVAGCNAMEADRLGPTLDVLGGSGFDLEQPWGILLTQARGNAGREMKLMLEGEDLPVLGIIPHLLKFARAFGLPIEASSEYEGALEGVLK